MIPPEFVDAGASAPVAATSHLAEPQLLLEDALGSPGRLWVRGRLLDPAIPPAETGGGGWLA